MTYSEISNMQISQKIKYDRRNPFRYFFDLISVEHAVIKTFYVMSGINPRSLKIILFFLQVSVQFMLNGIFYSDAIIEQRRVNQKASTVNTTQKTVFDTVLFELSTFPTKILPSIFFSICITFVLQIALMTPSENLRKLYNENIITKNEEYVKYAM